MTGTTQKLISGAGTAFALRVAGAGLGFGLNLLLARNLGATGMGLYFLALTLVSVFVLFGRMGLDGIVLREVAAAHSIGDGLRVRAVSGEALRLAAYASLAVMVCVYVSAPWLASVVFQKPELSGLLRLATAAILPIGLIVLLGEFLKAVGRIRNSQLAQAVFTPAFNLAVLLIIPAITLVTAMWSFVFAVAATAAVAYWLWRQARPAATGPGTDRHQALLIAGLPFMGIQFLNAVTDWADILLLGALGDAAEVGIYGMAKRITQITGFVLIAVAAVASPQFAALHRNTERTQLARLALKAARLAMVAALPILTLCLVFPGWVMGWFGEAFRAGGTVLMLLAISQLINIGFGFTGMLLTMTGHEKLMQRVFAVATALNLVLNAALIPSLGMVGAAIAQAATTLVLNLLAWFHVRRTLGFRCDIFAMAS